MGAQGKRFRVLRVELLDDLGPEKTGRTHLGHFHEVVHANSPEERQTRSEGVDVDACIDTGTEIFETVSESVGKLDVACRTGFLHVVAGDGDRVKFGHVLRSVFEDVGDDSHREFRRIYIGVAHHEFL